MTYFTHQTGLKHQATFRNRVATFSKSTTSVLVLLGLCLSQTALADSIPAPTQVKSAIEGAVSQSLVVPDNKENSHLGKPYHSDKKFFFEGTCAQGTEVSTLGNTRQDLFMELNINEQKLSDILVGSASADIEFGPYSVHGDISIDTADLSDEFSTTFTFIYRVTPKSQVLVPDNGQSRFNPSSACVTSAGYATPGQVKESIGDQFIYATRSRAYITLNMKIEFKNKMHKNFFAGAILLENDVLSLSAEGEYLDLLESNSVNISVKAEQEGGDPTALQLAIGDVSDCSPAAIQNCLAHFDSVIQYAKNDFPDQFEGNTSAFVKTTHYTTSYGHAALDELVDTSSNTPQMNSLSKLAAIDIKQAYKEASLARARADSLMGGVIDSEHELYAQIEAVSECSDRNAVLWAAAATECLENPYGLGCYTIHKNVKVDADLCDTGILNLPI